VKYNDLLFAIKKINNNGIDPSTVKIEFKAPKYYTTHVEADSHKKKKKDTKNNESNKDLFDWETNQQKQILSKMDAQPLQQTVKNKFIFESSVFKKEGVADDEKKSAVKKIDAPSASNGNILTWKKKGGATDSPPVKEIKRRDPNVVSGSDESDKAPKRKVYTMHESSEDNGLIRKK